MSDISDKFFLSEFIETTDKEKAESELSVKIIVSNVTGLPVQCDLFLFGPEPHDPIRVIHRFTLIEN